MKLPHLLLTLAVCSIPALAHADTILFNDSFENEGTGYNEPNPADSSFNDPTAPSGQAAVVQIIPGSGGSAITGQDGNRYLEINTSGSDSSSDTLTTKSTAIGTFSAHTTYTVSILMAQRNFGGDGSPGNLFNGVLALNDATTQETLDSVTHNFATGDMNFHLYSFSFDTLTDKAVVGDLIQLSIAADVNTDTFQGTDFDNVTITSSADPTPEPSSYALMLGGLTLVLGLCVRRKLA